MTTNITETLALAGIDELTRATLRQTWPLIRDGVPVALQAALAPAVAKGAEPGKPTRAQIESARQTQARHWQALFAAEFDDAYAESVSELAIVHARVGLDPRWLVAGYLTTLTELHSLVLAAYGSAMMTWSARSRLERAIRAVDQAVLFDLQICIAAYTEQAALMAHDKMLEVARQLQSAAPTLAPPQPADRRATNELFVASQRHTFHAVTADAPVISARQAGAGVSAAAAASPTQTVPA